MSLWKTAPTKNLIYNYLTLPWLNTCSHLSNHLTGFSNKNKNCIISVALFSCSLRRKTQNKSDTSLSKEAYDLLVTTMMVLMSSWLWHNIFASIIIIQLCIHILKLISQKLLTITTAANTLKIIKVTTHETLDVKHYVHTRLSVAQTASLSTSILLNHTDRVI